MSSLQESLDRQVEYSCDPTRASRAPIVLWASLFGGYLLAVVLANKLYVELVNIVAWTIAPVLAGVSAWYTSRSAALLAPQRHAWRTIALACASWFVGQLLWDYSALVQHVFPGFPSIDKVFFLGYAALFVKAVPALSDSASSRRFTLQHLGNLGLIGCCLAVSVVITFFEPAMRTSMPLTTVVGALVHCTLIAMTFFASIYCLWTHRWHASWVPMLLVVKSTGIYSLGNFVYAHALLTGDYTPADAINATWVVAFLLLGLAAHLRRTYRPSARVNPLIEEETIGRRARQLEATVPALLIVLMVAIGMSVSEQLSARALGLAAFLMLLFALILGAREAWIQAEAQRLTLELQRANERLRGTNAELQESEARVRDLNVHLEERVAERTRQLQMAYEELEGFSYAVAHDLKAPLRAIDGFGQLLDDTLRDGSDAQSRTYLTRIRRGAIKMASLIDDLLAYSRIERRALTTQTIDLHLLITNVVEQSSQEIQSRGIALRMTVPALQVRADVEGLQLVIRNILENAIKFTQGVAAPTLDISARENGDDVEIVIRDNGIGFDMQYHEQIFKLFHRLHRDDQFQGTGIGLALVRKALERMRGSIRAESSEGKGAAFHVTIPRGKSDL